MMTTSGGVMTKPHSSDGGRRTTLPTSAEARKNGA